MDARSTYDETNEAWPYFIITLSLVVLIPLTVLEIRKLLTFQKTTSNPKFADFNSRLQKLHSRTSIRKYLLPVLWVLFAVFLKYFLSQPELESKSSSLWDPYEILGLKHSASLKEIKSTYRRLSLEFHPDKVKDTAERAREEIEQIYVEISKAYRALTDEVTRENYLLHGHPDGPQPVKHGIALPAFLFNPVAVFGYILTYIMLFGGIIPYLVYLWWNRSLERTRKGLLQQSATQFTNLLVKEQPHFISFGTLVDEVLKCEDITFSLEKFNYPLNLDQRKLKLNAYLHRENVDDVSLLLAHEVERVLTAFHSLAVYFKSFELCSKIVAFRKSVVQAVPLNDLSAGFYLQATEDKIVKEESKEKLLKQVNEKIPVLKLVSAEFRVIGEPKVTVNSQVYLEIRYIVHKAGNKIENLSKEQVQTLVLNEEQRLKTKNIAPASNFKKYIDDLNHASPKVLPAIAPFFPGTVDATYRVYVYGVVDNKLVEDPYEITNMDLHNFKVGSFKFGDDLYLETVRIPFNSTSPPDPMSVPFKVAMLSTAYFGVDILSTVQMEVVAAAPVVVDDSIDESSDEEIEGLSDLDTDTEDEETESK